MKLDIEACDVPSGGVQFTFLESERFPSSSCLLTRHFPTEIVDALDHEVGSDALFVGEENGAAAFEQRFSGFPERPTPSGYPTGRPQARSVLRTPVGHSQVRCRYGMPGQKSTRSPRPNVQGVDPGVPTPCSVLASYPAACEHDVEVCFVHRIVPAVSAQFGSAPTRDPVIRRPESEQWFRQALALEQGASHMPLAVDNALKTSPADVVPPTARLGVAVGIRGPD